MRRGSPGHSGCDRATGFTLIELMVVAAIIIVLLTMAIPSIRSIIRTSQQAQAENTLRAALMGARAYAIQNQVVAGIRCQSDGLLVQIYARNMSERYADGDFTKIPVYDMKAVDGAAPVQMPDAYRVTAGDVGVYGYNYTLADNNWSHFRALWVGPTQGPDAGYYAAPEWLGGEHPWFVFPVVLFNETGRNVLAECKFHYDTNPNLGWYPTMAGAFGEVCDNAINKNRWFYRPGTSNPRVYESGQEPLKHTNQVMFTGWRCTSIHNYKGTGSHHIPIESPSVTAAPHIINYTDFRAWFSYKGSRGPFDYAQIAQQDPQALETLKDVAITVAMSGSTCMVDVNTGMLVRRRVHQKTGNN